MSVGNPGRAAARPYLFSARAALPRRLNVCGQSPPRSSAALPVFGKGGATAPPECLWAIPAAQQRGPTCFRQGTRCRRGACLGSMESAYCGSCSGFLPSAACLADCFGGLAEVSSGGWAARRAAREGGHSHRRQPASFGRRPQHCSGWRRRRRWRR